MLLAAWMLVFGAGHAQSGAGYAVLVVSDSGNSGKVLLEEVGRALRQRGLFGRVAVMGYDYGNPDHRAYCASVLGVSSGDIPFLGVVRVEGNVPREVVHRIGAVTQPSSAAESAVAEVARLSGAGSAATAPPVPITYQAAPGTAIAPETAQAIPGYQAAPGTTQPPGYQPAEHHDHGTVPGASAQPVVGPPVDGVVVEHIYIEINGPKPENMNFRVRLRNRGDETVPGPIVVRLLLRAGPHEGWTALREWIDLSKLPAGQIASRDYLPAADGTVNPLLSAQRFQMRATATLPDGRETFQEVTYP
ncbi:MAG: hypothetical protein HY319_32850 [Armatimonadetes bacterium]|nr:hypothetical protein [Armatimonadota bacterium]